VTSDSRYGSRNPNALSKYIPDEDMMHHSERKSFTLPCGWTLAQSWAALRKAWLGFKIASSNGDSILMTHYASFIIRVQTEMGIQVTDFDPAILGTENSRTCLYKEQPEIETETKNELEERSLDYDSMMEEARTSTNPISLNIDPPRKNIFGNSKNSCWYPPKNSCWYPPQEKKGYLQSNVNLPTNTEDGRFCSSAKQSWYEGETDGGSCYYYHEPASDEDYDEPAVQEKFDNWDFDEHDEDEVDGTRYYRVPRSGNESPYYEHDDRSEMGEDEEEAGAEVIPGVNTSCYCPPPASNNEPQYQEEDDEMDRGAGEVVVGLDTCYYSQDDKSWELEDSEIDGAEVLVGVDTCYYRVPDGETEPPSHEAATQGNKEGSDSSELRSCIYKSIR